MCKLPKVIEGWPKPKVMKELRGFLGLCNFYSQYVPKYAEMAKPLMELLQTKHLKTDVQQRTSMMKVHRNEAAEAAFVLLCLGESRVGGF